MQGSMQLSECNHIHTFLVNRAGLSGLKTGSVAIPLFMVIPHGVMVTIPVGCQDYKIEFNGSINLMIELANKLEIADNQCCTSFPDRFE